MYILYVYVDMFSAVYKIKPQHFKKKHTIWVEKKIGHHKWIPKTKNECNKFSIKTKMFSYVIINKARQTLFIHFRRSM